MIKYNKKWFSSETVYIWLLINNTYSKILTNEDNRVIML